MTLGKAMKACMVNGLDGHIRRKGWSAYWVVTDNGYGLEIVTDMVAGQNPRLCLENLNAKDWEVVS